MNKIIANQPLQSKVIRFQNNINPKPSQAQQLSQMITKRQLSQIITKRKQPTLNSLNRISYPHPNDHKTTTSNPPHQTRTSQIQKLQQLKSRFKKIKNSYQQNHKKINSSITNCIQNYKQRSLKCNNTNLNQFQILNQELTFSQSRQFNPDDTLNFHIHNRQISFREINPVENVNIGRYQNKENFTLPRYQNKENTISSANHTLNTSHEIKYKSLTKELQNMRQTQLVDLLIDQIQDNQTNKHLIAQQTQTLNALKNQSLQRHSIIPKLTHEIQSKTQQINILLETERKNLQIIEKLKRQLQDIAKNQEKSLSLQHSQIHKSSRFKKDICINTASQQSSKIFPQKQDSDPIDYKLKHDELQKYMNQYISNVNQAHEEYKRNLQQLKESNHSLKQQNINLTQELNQSHNFRIKLQNEFMQVSKDFQKLSHALNNSKQVIKQLEEEFLIVRQDNSQMKSIIQKQGTELIEMKNSKQMLILEMDTLMMDNDHLHHRNNVLNEELAQIQDKILTNTEIQTEVRSMISALTQQKSNLQNEVQNLSQENQRLKRQQKINQKAIQSLQYQQTTDKTKIKSLETTLKCLQNTIKQLRTRQELLQKQNNILQQTNQEMQKLQEELLFEYQSEKQQKNHLRNQLLAIMSQVKQMENIYLNELSSNEMIKKELQKYWQNHFSSLNQNNPSLNSKNNQHPQEETSKVTIMAVTHSHLKSQNSLQKLSSSDISFKKNSQLTKQGSGSSTILRHNLNSEEIGTFSKASQQDQNCINASSIVEGSRISEKYYSQTDEDVHQELQILRSSKRNNVNLNCEAGEGKIRGNWKVGEIKSKQNKR